MKTSKESNFARCMHWSGLLVSLMLACRREPVEGNLPATSGQWATGERAATAALSTNSAPVRLWCSHILIRYEGASEAVPFGPDLWQFPEPESARTHVEARQLAEEVAAMAQRDPLQFAELARRYSDDVATRDSGGSLGGGLSSRFRPWPHVARALQALKEGAVSGVVETAAGYHVLQRRPPPLDEQVSRARIVIGHDRAPWLARFVGRDDKPTVSRSRAAALELARSVYAEAVREPGRFDVLAKQYSEHRDAERGGDLGQWSTHESGALARELELLQQLRVGELHPPIDTLLGFEVLIRTPLRPRQRYAMSAIRLRFNPDAPAAAMDGRDTVATLASKLAREVAAEPESLSALQRRFCCTEPLEWVEGRRAPALERALDRLAVGEVAREPVLADLWYFVPKRLAPSEPLGTLEPPLGESVR